MLNSAGDIRRIKLEGDDDAGSAVTVSSGGAAGLNRPVALSVESGPGPL